jgi:hypothetical protein
MHIKYFLEKISEKEKQHRTKAESKGIEMDAR